MEGRSALIVHDDADLDLAISGGAWASWLHQGQICMSAGRHLVQVVQVRALHHQPVGGPDGLKVFLASSAFWQSASSY